MSDETWATAFADLLVGCGRDASVHSGYSWLITALSEFVSEIRGVLGVGVEVLMDSTMLV
jgi:hypothetical protein